VRARKKKVGVDGAAEEWGADSGPKLRAFDAVELHRHAEILRGMNIIHKFLTSSTYGHSQLKTGHPVRSAIHKQLNGRLVLRWVTTWESLLLYCLSSITSFSTYSHIAFVGMQHTILIVVSVLIQKHICLFLVQGHAERFSRSIPIYRRIPSTVSPCR
jgi:hypothetical protein